MRRVRARLARVGARLNQPGRRRGPQWGSVADRLGRGDAAVHRVLPVLAAGAAVVLAVAVVLLLRRRSRAGRVLAEGACPACLAVGLLGPSGQPAAATDSQRA